MAAALRSCCTGALRPLCWLVQRAPFGCSSEHQQWAGCSGFGLFEVAGTGEHKGHRCRERSTDDQHGDDGEGVVGLHWSCRKGSYANCCWPRATVNASFSRLPSANQKAPRRGGRLWDSVGYLTESVQP